MRSLLYSAAAVALAAGLAGCGKKVAPTQAPVSAPAPSPAPSSAPQAAPTSAPSPVPTNGVAPASAAPAPTSAPAPTPTAAPPQAAPENRPPSENPFENDLADLEVAIRLRNEFEANEGETKFEFKVTMTDGSHPIDETFVLYPTQDVNTPFLQRETREGFKMLTFRLADSDRERMRAAEQKLNQLKAQSTGGNELDFLATVQTRMVQGATPPETYSLTMYARSHRSVDFVPLGEETIVQRSDPNAAHLFT